MQKVLFNKAIAESPASDCFYSDTKTATKWAKRFLELVEIDQSETDKLLDLPVDILLQASAELVEEMTMEMPGNIAFQPVIGDMLMPIHPIEALANDSGSRVPLITGSNENEGTMFTLPYIPKIFPITNTQMDIYLAQNYPDTLSKIWDAYKDAPIETRAIAMGGDVSIWLPAMTLASEMFHHCPTYLYRFRWTSDYLKEIGLHSFHTLEIPFVFANFEPTDVQENLQGTDGNETRILSNAMHQAWINFAHTGNPNHEGIINWEQYDTSTRYSLIFDKNITGENDVDEEHRKIWGK